MKAERRHRNQYHTNHSTYWVKKTAHKLKKTVPTHRTNIIHVQEVTISGSALGGLQRKTRRRKHDERDTQSGITHTRQCSRATFIFSTTMASSATDEHQDSLSCVEGGTYNRGDLKRLQRLKEIESNFVGLHSSCIPVNAIHGDNCTVDTQHVVCRCSYSYIE